MLSDCVSRWLVPVSCLGHTGVVQQQPHLERLAQDSPHAHTRPQSPWKWADGKESTLWVIVLFSDEESFKIISVCYLYIFVWLKICAVTYHRHFAAKVSFAPTDMLEWFITYTCIIICKRSNLKSYTSKPAIPTSYFWNNWTANDIVQRLFLCI